MADFELTPEAVADAAETQSFELEAQVQEVAAQAAAIDVAPAIDFAPEFAPAEEEKEDPLAKFTPDEQRQIRAVAEDRHHRQQCGARLWRKRTAQSFGFR